MIKRLPRLPRLQSGTDSVSRTITGRKKMTPVSQKRSSSGVQAYHFTNHPGFGRGFLGMWDLYEIPENAKFLEGMRDSPKSSHGMWYWKRKWYSGW